MKAETREDALEEAPSAVSDQGAPEAADNAQGPVFFAVSHQGAEQVNLDSPSAVSDQGVPEAVDNAQGPAVFAVSDQGSEQVNLDSPSAVSDKGKMQVNHAALEEAPSAASDQVAPEAAHDTPGATDADTDQGTLEATTSSSSKDLGVEGAMAERRLRSAGRRAGRGGRKGGKARGKRARREKTAKGGKGKGKAGRGAPANRRAMKPHMKPTERPGSLRAAHRNALKAVQYLAKLESADVSSLRALASRRKVKAGGKDGSPAVIRVIAQRAALNAAYNGAAHASDTLARLAGVKTKAKANSRRGVKKDRQQ